MRYWQEMLFICLMALGLSSFVWAQQRETVYLKIKYISADHVYIEGGAKVGLEVEDTLRITKGTEVNAQLLVEYVSENSASCSIIQSKITLVAGMMVTFFKPEQQKEKATAKQKPDSMTTVTSRRENKMFMKPKSISRVSGSISAEYYQYSNRDDSRFNNTQPALRLYLKARNMFSTEGLNLHIRARSRYYDRGFAYSSQVPQNEWRHRIYEASFSYNNEKSPINFQAGRIISNKFSGVGFIDGLLLQHNVSTYFNWGIFGGMQPEWNYSKFQSSLQKYGAFLNFDSGNEKRVNYAHTTALAAEYHGSIVSREMIYMRNVLSQTSSWSIYQFMEVDINRGWRKEKAGQTFSLTSLYLNARYNLTHDLSWSVGLDNRKNYFTYELRTLADSLFDAASRRGIRTDINWRVNSWVRVQLRGGMRYKAGDKTSTYSWGGSTQFMKLWQNISVQLRVNGFNSLYSDGINPSAYIGKSFRAGHYVGASFGLYSYKLKTLGGKAINRWVRLNTSFELPLDLFLNGYYDYTWGDGLNGNGFQVELGYRF